MTRYHNRLNQIRKIVYGILVENPNLEDREVYVKVCETICPKSLNLPFVEAYLNGGMPNTESVRRSRAYCQEHFEECKPNDELSAKRLLLEEDYKEFVNV